MGEGKGSPLGLIQINTCASAPTPGSPQFRNWKEQGKISQGKWHLNEALKGRWGLNRGHEESRGSAE